MGNYNSKKMIFKGHNGQRVQKVVFDDFVDSTEEYGTYWCGICPCCLEKYKSILGNRVDEVGYGTCSVEGCWNKAEHYVDFDQNEVYIQRVYKPRKKEEEMSRIEWLNAILGANL
jgi:hypothetical protein